MIFLSTHKSKGFTLIELIIYLAIVSVILTVISYLMLDIVSGQSQTVSEQEVIYAVRSVSRIVTRDIQSAQAISSFSPSSITPASPQGPIIYTLDATAKKLLRQAGA